MGDIRGWTAMEVCDCVVCVEEEAEELGAREEMGSVVGLDDGKSLMRD